MARFFTRFRWRLRKRIGKAHINWRALKPDMTTDDNPSHLNQTFDDYNTKCEELWHAHQREADDVVSMNRVYKEAAKLIIPIAKPEVTRRM